MHLLLVLSAGPGLAVGMVALPVSTVLLVVPWMVALLLQVPQTELLVLDPGHNFLGTEDSRQC